MLVPTAYTLRAIVPFRVRTNNYLVSETANGLFRIVLGSNHPCDKLFSLMNDDKSRIKMLLTDEHSEGRMEIAVTEIKRDNDRKPASNNWAACLQQQTEFNNILIKRRNV
jgi:hypothetical protein